MTISIDLGVISHEPSPPPDRSARPSGWGQSPRRLVATAACLLLTGGLLGASALPVRQRLPEARVPVGPTDIYFLTEDVLYVIGPEADAYTTVPRTITAYTVPGGERLWQHPIEDEGPFSGLSGVGDVLLALFGARPEDQRTVALDATTAAPLWERAGGPPLFEGDDSLLFVTESHDGGPVAWERVRTSTGERLLRRDFPPGTSLQPVDDWNAPDERLMATLPGGRIEIWDTATDRLVNAAELPLQTSLIAHGAVGLTSIRSATGTTLIGYALPQLRQIWTHEFGSPSALHIGCGTALLCVSGGEDNVLTAIDPATGDALWENGTYGWFTSLGPVLLTDGYSSENRGDPLLAVDPRSGRTLRDFGPWTLIRREYAPDPGRTVVAQFDETEKALLVAEVDLRALTLRVLGRVRDVREGCSVEGAVLFCRTLDGAAGMWELPVTP